MDQQKRAVSFPGVVNMVEGPIEYLLVTAAGKVHESVLRTEAEPFEIHAAMLLLGAKGASGYRVSKPTGQSNTPDSTPARSQPLTNGALRSAAIVGDRVTVEVSWANNGKPVRWEAEHLVSNTATKAAMGRGHWVYNGSLVSGGTFLAQQSGSIVSIITDPGALINYTGPLHESDEVWVVRGAELPLRNTEVQITLKLQPSEPIE